MVFKRRRTETPDASSLAQSPAIAEGKATRYAKVGSSGISIPCVVTQATVARWPLFNLLALLYGHYTLEKQNAATLRVQTSSKAQETSPVIAHFAVHVRNVSNSKSQIMILPNASPRDAVHKTTTPIFNFLSKLRSSPQTRHARKPAKANCGETCHSNERKKRLPLHQSHRGIASDTLEICQRRVWLWCVHAKGE